MDRSRMNRSRLFSSFRANVVAAISSRSNRQSWHSIPYRKGFQPAEEFPFDCFGQLVQCYEPVLTGTELNIYRLNRSHKSRFTPSLPGFTGFTLFFFSRCCLTRMNFTGFLLSSLAEHEQTFTLVEVHADGFTRNKLTQITGNSNSNGPILHPIWISFSLSHSSIEWASNCFFSMFA